MGAPVRIYIVGGAVRDRLLGLPVKDRDWVVVGATPEWMQAQGYRPVGKDFPVFLHPRTHEEYALARTERKTAPGYHGFVFHADASVTLEDDLARRDLTINAMAEDDTGQLIDPYHGQADLQAGLLRHVSPAFAEDPVRILRLARFAARFGFTVAPETRTLMGAMVEAGEVDALVAERVWQEMAKALLENAPSRFFQVLDDTGALARVAPELCRPTRSAALAVLDEAARRALPLAGRFAVFVNELPQGELDTLCERLRVPNDCRELARLLIAQRQTVASASLSSELALALFKATDALRRPERFAGLLEALACLPDVDTDHLALLGKALDAARSIDAGAIAKQAASPREIPLRVDAARLEAMAGALDRT